jgi:hypothetical protein
MHFEAQFAALPTFDPDDHAPLTVVETAKGSRNKLSYNMAFCAFELRKVLPVGMIFPYDFGFVPGICSTTRYQWAAWSALVQQVQSKRSSEKKIVIGSEMID